MYNQNLEVLCSRIRHSYLSKPKFCVRELDTRICQNQAVWHKWLMSSTNDELFKTKWV